MSPSVTTTGITAHIAVIDGQPTTTTQDIAEVYGRRHEYVLRIVRQRMAEAGEWGVANFGETPYTNPQNGQTYTVIRMTKKGFHFLVGKFTGAKAVQHQIAFADAFERMEAELSQNKPAIAINPTSGIDVRTLFCTGQSEPVPLLPAHMALLEQRAWEMAGQAHGLIRTHLLRRIAHHTIARERGNASDPMVANILQATTLGSALAGFHYDGMAALLQMMETNYQMYGEKLAATRAHMKALDTVLAHQSI